MKKLLIIWALITSLFLSPQVYGQVSVNININSQPAWGPVGYDYVEYYFIPELGIYYNVPYQKYIYYSGGNWIWVRTLPTYYSHYNIYNVYKVVINEPAPYMHYHQHKIKYAHYKTKHYHGKQQIIRDHPEVKKSKLPKQGTTSPSKSTPSKSNLPKKGVSSPSKSTPTKSNLPKQGTTSPSKSTPTKSNLPKKGVSSPTKSTPTKSNLPKSGVQKQGSPQKSNLPKQGGMNQKSSPTKSNLPKSGGGQKQQKGGLPKSGKGGHH